VRARSLLKCVCGGGVLCLLYAHSLSSVSLSSLSPLSLLSVQAVLAELQQAGVITGGEGRELIDISAVVRLQSKNSPEVMVTTAKILRRHGFEKESEVLSGWLGWHFVK